MANSDINSVVIVGRLTRDAELRYLNSGTAVASISIAVNRSKKDGDQWISEANFFDVSYFIFSSSYKILVLRSSTRSWLHC